MSTLSTSSREARAFIPHQAPVGIERDHLWWINDASRIVRTDAWNDLEPQHVRHLIEEIRDLQILLDRAWALDPPDPL